MNQALKGMLYLPTHLPTYSPKYLPTRYFATFLLACALASSVRSGLRRSLLLLRRPIPRTDHHSVEFPHRIKWAQRIPLVLERSCPLTPQVRGRACQILLALK